MQKSDTKASEIGLSKDFIYQLILSNTSTGYKPGIYGVCAYVNLWKNCLDIIKEGEFPNLSELMKYWKHFPEMFDSIDAPNTTGVYHCEACETKKLEGRDAIINTVNNKILYVGSECIRRYGITLHHHITGEPLDDKDVNAWLKLSVNERAILRQRAYLYELTKHESFIAIRKHKKSKNLLKPDEFIKLLLKLKHLNIDVDTYKDAFWVDHSNSSEDRFNVLNFSFQDLHFCMSKDIVKTFLYCQKDLLAKDLDWCLCIQKRLKVVVCKIQANSLRLAKDKNFVQGLKIFSQINYPVSDKQYQWLIDIYNREGFEAEYHIEAIFDEILAEEQNKVKVPESDAIIA